MAKVIIDKPKAKALSKFHALERTKLLTRQVQIGAWKRLLDNDNFKTGALYLSIKIKINDKSGLIIGQVGSAKRYAMVIHQGAKPHLIAPRRKRGLKFYWPAGVGNPPLKVGRVVCYKGVVHHPGFKSNRYLLIPLVLEAPRFGFFPTPLV
jgi:hypothetical protein